jgi:Prokaryotic E2 family E
MSDFGPDRLVRELVLLGYQVETVNAGGSTFVVFPEFEVPAGQFIGRIIALGLQATPDYPNSVAAAIHVKATPQLLPDGSVPNVRNVQPSVLGAEWRYWSKNFNWHAENEKTARRFMSKINTIFENA